MRLSSRLLSLGIGLFSVVPFGAANAESIPKQEPASSSVLTRKPFGERFRLFAELILPLRRSPFVGALASDEKRLFHNSGDPDSLFTFGGSTPQGNLHLTAAFEVNDVVLRSIAPDLRVDPGDTRPRAPGDYRALDASGRPYQLRLGARLVW
ncbi:MAG: hypothetical protein ABIT01_08295 [Thermoanaerobaculia bacterium]